MTHRSRFATIRLWIAGLLLTLLPLSPAPAAPAHPPIAYTVHARAALDDQSIGLSPPVRTTFGLGKVTSAAITADGQHALLGVDGDATTLVNLTSGAIERRLNGVSSGATAVAIAPGGARYATAGGQGGSGALNIWSSDGGLIRTIEGINAQMTGVAFSPDGTRLLAGGYDFVARLWDVASGQQIRVFQESGQAAIASVAFAPDGTRVLTGHYDSKARLWDVVTGQLIRSFSGHTAVVQAVAFAPDGARILTGSGDSTARLWDAATGQVLQTFSGHTFTVYAVAFAPDGGRVLTGSGDSTARLWDAATGQLIRTFSGHTQGLKAALFTPDGAHILTGGDDQTARIWDANTGTPIRTIAGHLGAVNAVAFAPDGARILTGSDDQTARIWDAASGASLLTFNGHTARVTAVAFSPDGTQALTGGDDNVARLWNAATGQPIRVFTGHTIWITSVAFAPDGTKIATGSFDHTARLWDVATGQLIRTFQHADTITALAFAPDGTRLLTSSAADAAARLWDIATGALLQTFSGHAGRVKSVAFAPDGTQVLTGSEDTTARLWDAASGQLIRIFAPPSTLDGAVRSVAFAPDGRSVAVGAGYYARLWNVAAGQQVRTFRARSYGQVLALAFAPNGTQLLTGYDNAEARLWDIGGPVTPGKRFGGHTGDVVALAFSPGGTRYATAGTDRLIRLWDATSGDLLQTFRGHAGAISSIAFSPDGLTLLSGADTPDNAAWLWDIASGRPVRAFQDTLPVRAVAFSPDGARVLTANYNTAQTWNTANGAPLQTFAGPGNIFSAAFAPDGASILTGHADTTARLWDAASGAVIRTFTGHTGLVASVAFSPDGTRILTGSYDNTARVWNANTGATITTFTGHTSGVESVAFAPDGQTALTGSNDHTARIWSAGTGVESRQFVHAWTVRAVAFAPGGQMVLTTAKDERTARLWSVVTGQQIGTVPTHAGQVNSVAYSPDRTKIVTGDGDNTARIWDTANGRRLATLSGHTGSVGSVAFSPDSARVATGSSDNTARVWDVATGALVRTLNTGFGGVGAVAFTPDGQRLVVGHYSNSGGWAEVWDIAASQIVITLTTIDSIYALALSPDGTRAVLGGSNGFVRVYDLATGQAVQIFAAQGSIESVAYSPDGTQVLAGGLDNTARLWDVASGRLLRMFPHTPDIIYAVAFSPDGRMIATAGQTAYLWDAVTGDLAFALDNNGNYAVSDLAFASDSTHLLTGGFDGSAQIWQLDTSRYTTGGPTPLGLDTPEEGTVAPAGTSEYVVQVPAGRPLLVEITPLDGTQELWVLGRHNARPTLARYDLSARQPTASGTYAVLVPPGPASTLYLGVIGRQVGAPHGAFRIVAYSPDQALVDVAPRAAGNGSRATLSLSGLGFTAGMRVELQAAGRSPIAAGTINLAAPTTLWARFDLAGVPAGSFDVVAIWPGGVQLRLPGAFQLTTGTGPRLEAQLITPPTVRINRDYVAMLEYANVGDSDMPAPVLQVTAHDGLLRLGAGDPYASAQVQALGVSFEQPADVLRPGARYRIPIYLRATGDNFQLDLDQMVASANTIDWAAVEADVRPPDLAPGAWAALWGNFKAQVGTTWGDYLRAMGDQAAYLAQHGSLSYDAQDLFGVLLSNASGAPTSRTLADTTDAYISAPGLPLLLTRVMGASFDQRFHSGPFGYGWSHSFDYLLAQPDERNLVIMGPGGAARRFVKAPSGRWQPLAGDTATLEPASNGGFQMRELAGLTWTFDTAGQLVTLAEPNGNHLTLSYTAGHLSTITHSNGQRLLLEYNDQGRISRLTDHAGRVTTYSYDASGVYLTSVSRPGGVTTQYAYVPAAGGPADHALQTITLPDGTHQFYGYDAQGRLAVRWRDDNAEHVTYGYNNLGMITVADATNATTTLHFGVHGELLEMSDALGQTQRFQYDSVLNLIRATAPDGTSAQVSYDSRGNPIQTIDPLGANVGMGYSANLNRLALLRDGRGNLTSLDYDASGNLTGMNYPGGPAEHATYDTTGNLSSTTNRRGQTIHFSYNALGQLTRKDLPDGHAITYGYDPVGRLTAVTDTSGTIALQYDARDFLTRIDYPSGHWFTFAYNDTGQRTRRIGDDGYTLNYSYDTAGRLARIADGSGAELVRYTYDSAGRLSGETRGNGTSAGYTYDAIGRLASLVNRGPGGAIQSSFTYQYDSSGNRTAQITPEGTTSYGYDAAGQLTGMTYPDGSHETISYDAAGNRISLVSTGAPIDYTTNALNQPTQVGPTNYSYDADGNLTAKNDASGTTAYTYDSEGRLARIAQPGGTTWEYEFDGLGNRITVRRNGTATHYVHDPAGLVDVAAEYNNAGTITARYVHGLGLVARISPSTGPAYYGYDGSGNTRQLTDAAGAIANRYDYTPFGLARQISETVPNSFRFVGQLGVMDDGNGLHFMRARFYDAELGRFLSIDPLRIFLPHLYAYAKNNPISQVDPTGLDSGAYLFGRGWSNYHEGNQAVYCYLAGQCSADVLDQAQALQEQGRQDIREGAPDFSQELMNDSFSQFQDGPPKSLDDIPAAETFRDLACGLGYFCKPDHPVPYPTQPLDKKRVPVARPIDPNEKVSPPGLGPDRFVPGDAPLVYTIYFENRPTASAPAQEVFVTDDLDPNLDWASLRIVEVAFGDTLIPLDDAALPFGTRRTIADYRADNGTSWTVEVSGVLEQSSGRVRWTIRTLDPETNELPEDALAGFLPPNDASGRGEGHITFTILPKPGLALGTRVTNQASIVFDTEQPIVTNETWNTIADAVVFLPLVRR